MKSHYLEYSQGRIGRGRFMRIVRRSKKLKAIRDGLAFARNEKKSHKHWRSYGKRR